MKKSREGGWSFGFCETWNYEGMMRVVEVDMAIEELD